MTRGRKKKQGKKQQPFFPVEIYRINSPKSYSTYPYLSYDPSEVGKFVTDLRRNVVKCDDASLFPSFLPDVALPLDLNVGYEEYTKEKAKLVDKEDGRLPLWQRFLKWIEMSDFDTQSVDFVARRGILKFIGFTLYNRFKSPWNFRACKYNGIVYIYEPDPELRANHTIDNEFLRRAMYWGKKFEDYVAKSSDDVAGSYSMVKGSIGKYKVLLGAEVDAVREFHLAGNGTSVKPEYVELKTCAKKKVREKVSFGWLQSYLAGVTTLIFGCRDNDGYVQSLNEYAVASIPNLFTAWNPCSMFGMISSVLNWLYQHLDDGMSGQLVYNGENEIILIQESGHFLPEWYLKHLHKS